MCIEYDPWDCWKHRSERGVVVNDRLKEDVMPAAYKYVTTTFVGLAVILGCSDSWPSTAPGLAKPTSPQRLGSIEVTVSTVSADADIDPDGYRVTIDEGQHRTIGGNGTWTIGDQAIGSHRVLLHGLASNCSVKTENPRRVEVITDEAASPVAFSVLCIAKDGSGAGDWDY
jgi:hypothetical protein